MTVFHHPAFDDHERVVFVADSKSGLRAMIAVHRCGPRNAMGGTRMREYALEADGIGDALRLSQTMTYKSALAGLPFGGGKAVIFGDSGRDKTPELLHAMGSAIDRLGGHFVTGEDVGISVDDVALMRENTPHVLGGEGVDSAQPAAAGVLASIQAAAERVWGTSDLSGRIIAVQGLGKVGYWLTRMLAEAGARLLVADIRPDAVRRVVREFDAQEVSSDDILTQPTDVFAPCALGDVLTPATVPRLKAKVVAGAANNQLSAPIVGALLRDAGILYAPDFIANGGGLINNAALLDGYDRTRVLQDCARIGHTLTEVFELADKNNTSTNTAAAQLARQRTQNL
ncbi:amino acid dehydrogenase [Actinomadura soli]|uniref:Amino acid dehydrogenase n=1 Tax=Actinomadura soli TaxID=2508997 RepID=A0A5C4J7B4_9ACTN|nr:amino acid dehydrogenase [Actinomadura soli]TMQ93471.1 amino acid dehydrogenase [Actinomadura soli]